MAKSEELLNEYDVSRELGLDVGGVRHLIRKGVLRARAGRGEWLISRRELEKCLLRFSQDDIEKWAKEAKAGNPQSTVSSENWQEVPKQSVRQGEHTLRILQVRRSRKVVSIVLICLAVIGYTIYSPQIRVGMTAYHLAQAWGEPDRVIRGQSAVSRIYIPGIERPSGISRLWSRLYTGDKIGDLENQINAMRYELEDEIDDMRYELDYTQQQLRDLQRQISPARYTETWIYERRNRVVFLSGKSPALLKVTSWRPWRTN